MQIERSLTFRTPSLRGAFDGPNAFERMRRCFEEGYKKHPTTVWHSSAVFAGRLAQIRIVGTQLVKQIAPAIRHLLGVKVNEVLPGLKIDLWEENQTRIACPLESVEIDGAERAAWCRGEWGFTVGSGEDRFIGRRRFRMDLWLDRESQHLIGCVRDPERFSLLERGNPIRFPLFLWHGDRGAEVIHAGLVSRRGHGILLAGRGGVGKTTVALASLAKGFDYLADDYVALQPLNDGSFVGHSLYSSAWLADSHLSRFPSLIPNAVRETRPDQNRSLIFLYSGFADHLACSAPIHIVVLPRISNGSFTRFRAASKREALLALAPTSILNLPSTGTQALARMARLVGQVPCFWLEVGADLPSVSASLDSLLSELSLS
jgi:hypothetical protein